MKNPRNSAQKGRGGKVGSTHNSQIDLKKEKEKDAEVNELILEQSGTENDLDAEKTISY